MTKPDLTKYSDERLAEYHLFTLRMHWKAEVPNASMAWLREARRVQREVERRMEIAA